VILGKKNEEDRSKKLERNTNMIYVVISYNITSNNLIP
jgi:hypothetical protein